MCEIVPSSNPDSQLSVEDEVLETLLAQHELAAGLEVVEKQDLEGYGQDVVSG